MTFLLNFVIGIAIGSGAILPGISSGVLCVMFGIYETLLIMSKLYNRRKIIKRRICKICLL